MLNRIGVPAVMVAAGLALVAALSGCSGGPAQASSAGHTSTPGASHRAPPDTAPAATPPASQAPVGGLPNIAAVRLGTRFTPDTLQLGVGQQFVVIVSKDVKVSGSGLTAGCTPAAAAKFSSAMLSVRCTGSSFMYTALHAGSTTLSVTVRPNCAGTGACPAWIARATLRLTIS